MSYKPKHAIGVFVSYAREDRIVANRLAHDLQKVGYRAWTDFDGLVGGDKWKESIDEALRNSTALIVLLTPNAVSSKWVDYEITQALGRDHPIVPLLISPCKIPDKLDQFQRIDFFHLPYDVALSHLQTALLHIVTRDEKHPPPPPPGPEPDGKTSSRTWTALVSVAALVIVALAIVVVALVDGFGRGAAPDLTGRVDTSQYQKDPPYTFCFSNAWPNYKVHRKIGHIEPGKYLLMDHSRCQTMKSRLFTSANPTVSPQNYVC
jgi:hypothetical protein